MTSTPIDADRVHGLLAANFITGAPLIIAGYNYGSNTGALMVGIADGSGTQITTFPVSNPLSTAPLNGQSKIASTGTAVQLGSNTLLNGVIITAKSTNTASITVGGSGVTNTVNGTGNGYILEAGASASWAVSNTNQLYINGTTGDIVSFAGS